MRFGLAVRDITPPFRMPMYGYSSRRDVFDNVHDPLTFTALVLEEDGRRAFIGAADIGSFPNDGSTLQLMNRVAAVVGCPDHNVMLNASHTHGGPLVPMGERLMHGDIADSATVARYANWLYEQVEDAAAEASGSLREGSLWIAEGWTSVPMNRRPDRNGSVPNAPNPDGPVDNRLFCFLLRDAADRPVAVGIRVSCHPVATGAQHRITADYPGAWRAECKRAFGPAVHAFFLQGSGADARPRHVAEGDHWRIMDHAELVEIGRDLMAETLAALTGPNVRRLGPLVLEGRFEAVDLPCEPSYVRREDFEAVAADSGMETYAAECLARLAAGKTIPDHQTFHVQTLWLDRELALIGIDGEVLCGAGATVEAALSPKQGIVLGYTNGVIAYLPDSHEMSRGGYETRSFIYQPWTGPLKPGLEHLLAGAVYVRRD